MTWIDLKETLTCLEVSSYVSQHEVEMGRVTVAGLPRCRPLRGPAWTRIYILDPNKGYCDALRGPTASLDNV